MDGDGEALRHDEIIARIRTAAASTNTKRIRKTLICGYARMGFAVGM